MWNRTIPALALLVALPALAAEPSKSDLFEAKTGGYETYRIPGLVVTKRGTLLVYCEARRSAKSDWGDIDVLLRRSTDGGATFDAPRKIVEAPADAAGLGKQPGLTVNNPVAIADADSGAVHFLYCVQYARCFYMRSEDDGQTFSKPVEITAAFEALRPKYDWKVIATGPGHGIRLKTGRLLVPVWLASRKEHHPSCVATIYSDDDGKTWHAGEVVADNTKETPDPNETVAVELVDGRVMLNMRNQSPRLRRLIATSKDGATNWSKPVYDEGLPDVTCMASIARVGGAAKRGILFANPVGDGGPKRARKNLTLRLSYDEGQTWPITKLLESGIAAYSDLAVGLDRTICCFYECGGVNDQQYHTRSLRLARFTIDWVAEAEEK